MKNISKRKATRLLAKSIKKQGISWPAAKKAACEYAKTNTLKVVRFFAKKYKKFILRVVRPDFQRKRNNKGLVLLIDIGKELVGRTSAYISAYNPKEKMFSVRK